jgi:hypothetical protein
MDKKTIRLDGVDIELGVIPASKCVFGNKGFPECHCNDCIGSIMTYAENDKTDAFLCVAFDNINDLNPVRVYLIPEKEVCGKHSILITSNTENQWTKYEKPIGKVIEACDLMKSQKESGNGY